MNPGSIHAVRTHWHAEAQELDVANALMERTQRDPIWRETERVFPARQQIPALNCRTGIDAVFLGESRNTSMGLRHGFTDDRARSETCRLDEHYWTDRLPGAGDREHRSAWERRVQQEVSNRKRPSAAIESGQAIQDPRMRSTDDCVCLQFEYIER